MRQRLSRIVRKVNNNRLQKQRAALPPVRELLREAQILRETFPDDPDVTAICNAFEQTTAEMIADGYTLREGGPEPKRAPLLPEWRGKEPPETN